MTMMILDTSKILLMSFIAHCLKNIIVCRTTIPKKYKPIPDLWIAGATLKGIAVINTVPELETKPMIKAETAIARPAPNWVSRKTSSTMTR